MAGTPPLILLIDDERAIRRFLRAALVEEGYDLVEASTAQEALSLAAAKTPSLVVLDLGLPDMDGLELLRRLRQWLRAPVIVLSARDAKNDKVTTLDAGADDYLTKPFAVEELLARIRVALRRVASTSTQLGSDEQFKIGDLVIDQATRRVTVGEKEVRLTPIEFRLLILMARHAGKVLTHHFLLTEVWGPDRADETQYLRVFMAGLRRKLEADPAQPRHLLTEQGVGYWLAGE